MKALVLGVFKDDKSDVSYTSSTQSYLNKHPDLKDQMSKVLGGRLPPASHRMVYNQNSDHDVVCFTNIGEKNQGRA